MNAYPLKLPRFSRLFFPSALLYKPDDTQTVYLTFDDGPSPEITEFVLNELKKYRAKATFFCLGDKIQRHPDILRQLIAENHRIANHSYHHLDAWKTSPEKYLKDVVKTEALIDSFTTSKKLFRPPFGHITPLHTRVLNKAGFQTVLWTSVSGDYKKGLDTEKVLKRLIRYTQSGDVLVFHDSAKASDNLRKILPGLLYHLHQKGFRFDSL